MGGEISLDLDIMNQKEIKNIAPQNKKMSLWYNLNVLPGTQKIWDTLGISFSSNQNVSVSSSPNQQSHLPPRSIVCLFYS